MKKQIRISKFFASKTSTSTNSSDKDDDDILIETEDDFNSSSAKQKAAEKGIPQRKRQLTCHNNEENNTRVSSKRFKSELTNADVESTETRLLSVKTKQKLDSFSADNTLAKETNKFSGRVKHSTPKSNVQKTLVGKNINQGIPCILEISDDDDAGPSHGDSSLSNNTSSSNFQDTFTSLKYKSPEIQSPSTSNKRTKCKYTPLELQFMAIKEKNPTAVLLVECGYKYRFFGEDAEIAAQVLKIFCHPDHNFMTASIPTHRLFVHVRRLVAAGYKVGVVKQTETAALKAAGENKGAPFSRELTALYTKSTLIGEDVDPLSDICNEEIPEALSSGGGNTHLMCIFETLQPAASKTKPQTIAIMSIQPSTGDLIYDCFEDSVSRSELETRVSHVQPAELLLPDTLSENTERLIKGLVTFSSTRDDRIRTERLGDDKFEHGQALQTVTQFYTSNETGTCNDLLQQVLFLPKEVICCLSGLIVYLTQFHLERVLKSLGSISQFTTKNKYMELNGNTLRNLEIFKNLTDGGEKGTLFSVMNHTVTRFGSRLLRKWLAQPLLDIGEIVERQQAVELLFKADSSDITKLPDLLRKMPDLEKGLCTIFHKKCSPLEFLLVIQSLDRIQQEFNQLTHSAASTIKSGMLNNICHQIPDLLSRISTFNEAIDEKAARDNNKKELFVNEFQFPDLIQIKSEIDEVLSKIKGHRREVRLTLKYPALEYVTVSGTEFLVEVKNSNLDLVPSDWLKISSTKAVSRFHTPFINCKCKELSQLREKLEIAATSAWFSFLQQFGENYQQYRQAVQHLAVLDCLFSLVTVARQTGYCRPDMVEETKLSIVEGRHSVVDHLMADQDQYVPNDTSLQGNGERVMIITGPNMGGKSSYIRQVALITIMAQIGSYVPAQSCQIGIFNSIYTRMGARDEIYAGRSTFMVELQEASEIMKNATSRSLVILDELGRGTSTHDGVAIALASLRYFITQVKCLTLFVTHYPSLSELEEEFSDCVKNYHMSFLLLDELGDSSGLSTDDSITFLYQLVQGTAARSYGLNVARLADIPKNIVNLASEKAKEMEIKVSSHRRMLEDFLSYFQSKDLQNSYYKGDT